MTRTIAFVVRIPAFIATTLIAVYQKLASPNLGANCRYLPTCSAYSRQAIDRFGLVKGAVLGVKRIGRCHPLHPGGFDPVPEQWRAG